MGGLWGDLKCLVAHDELELARAELAVGVAEGPVARDAREVRRRHVDPRRTVLPGGCRDISGSCRVLLSDPSPHTLH